MKAIFAALVMGLLLLGCVSQESPASQQQEQGKKIGTAVTLLPQAEFVESVGGNRVDVIVMVPPGASPHSHEPTPSQMAKLGDAVLYFKVGSGVEFETAWMDDMVGVNPNMKVVDSSEGIALIGMEAHSHDGEEAHVGGEEQGETDPHIWNSPANVKIMVRNIYLALSAESPKDEPYFRANRDSYLAKLDAVDASIRAALAGKTNRKFIVFHPAWGYFAREYGLEQVAIEEAGKEPTAQNLARVIDGAKEEGIAIVFASPQFSATGAKTVANEIGGSVVLISPLEKDYLKNMQRVSEALAASMK